MRDLSRWVFAVLSVTASTHAVAALGPYAHGHGIKSLGFGGVGMAIGEESTVITANPALTGVVGQRFDLGMDNLRPSIRGEIVGNAAGPDKRSQTRHKSVVHVPQGGIVIDLDGPYSLGFAVSVAGMALDYTNNNPYQRFGGREDAILALTQAGILTSLAYEVAPDHIIAGSVNVVYQTLNIKGAQPFSIASQAPGKVSNTGTDGSMGLGFGLGWYKKVTPTLSLGAAYRSKTWTKRHSEYAGLLPEQGKLEMPAHFGLGFAWDVQPNWTVAVDVMRYEYSAEKTFANGIEKFNQGMQFGADDGPGFGMRDQNVYKLGVAWQASPEWRLRAGLVDASQMMQSQNTLIDFMAPLQTTRHFTAGYTYQFGRWELSGYLAKAPRVEVKGRNSIPAMLGGGEANISNQFYAGGISLGRSFGVGRR